MKLDVVGLDPLDLLAQHVLVGTGCLLGATTNALAPCPVQSPLCSGPQSLGIWG